MKDKTGICDECKREVSEEGMLWVVYENRDICRKCYDKQWKEGMASIVHPWTATALDWEE